MNGHRSGERLRRRRGRGGQTWTEGGGGQWLDGGLRGEREDGGGGRKADGGVYGPLHIVTKLIIVLGESNRGEGARGSRGV